MTRPPTRAVPQPRPDGGHGWTPVVAGAARWELVRHWWAAEAVPVDPPDLAARRARRRAIGWGGWV